MEEQAFSQLHFIEGVSSIYRHRLNGILKIDNGHCIRQILFRDGDCLVVSSNAKMELPGSFLFQKQLLNTKQYESYLIQAADPNIRQWDLAVKDLELSPNEISQKKEELAEYILQNIAREKESKLVFANQTFPATVPMILSRKAFLERVVQEYSIDRIFSIAPKLKEGSTKLSLLSKEERNELSKEQQSIFDVLLHNSSVKEVFEASFLDKLLIYQTLFLFFNMGLITVESEDESSKRQFMTSLDEDQKVQRAEVENFYQKCKDLNYYRWLGVESKASAEDIKKKYQALKEKYENQEVKKLFNVEEQSILEDVVHKIEQAYQVLSKDDQRREYNQFLLEGKGHEFVHQSHTLKEKKILQDLQQAISKDGPIEALSFLEKEIENNPSLFLLPIAYAKLALKQELYRDVEINRKVFQFMKRAMTLFPYYFEIYEAFALWCKTINQLENAFRAYQKALLLNPSSLSLRKEMISIDIKKATAVIVEVLEKHKDHLSLYDILGVSSDQGSQDFHHAFRFCSKYFHPDRFFQNQDEQISKACKKWFKKMTTAYQTLKDSSKRKEYDISLGVGSVEAPDEESQKVFMNKFLPKTLHGRKYYETAMECLEKNDRMGASINLKLAIQYEPDNPVILNQMAQLEKA